MSGGHFNYKFYELDVYEGHMEDAELEELLKDFAELLHDLEWYKSGDYDDEEYRKTVQKFKAKWFKGDRAERLKRIVEEECAKLKESLMLMI